MVDRYSPIVAACLKDTSTLVRQQILDSLTSLIKEQFIRWEGQIMYRFVSAILDENKSIREYAMFCLRDVLLLQFPELFSGHFIECLMYFNNVPVSCERDAVHEVVDTNQRLSLNGPENEESRMTIYKFMVCVIV
ncbi:HEAT repeat protein [Cooperia oncophora]